MEEVGRCYSGVKVLDRGDRPDLTVPVVTNGHSVSQCAVARLVDRVPQTVGKQVPDVVSL